MEQEESNDGASEPANAPVLALETSMYSSDPADLGENLQA